MRIIRELLAEKTSRSRVQCGAVRLGALPMALHTRESAATLAAVRFITGTISIMSPASNAKWHARSGPSVAKRRCSTAWPGSMMALPCRNRLRTKKLIHCLEAIIIRETKQWFV